MKISHCTLFIKRKTILCDFKARKETDGKQMDEKWGFGGEANGSNV
jgi:hypothetical protein